MKLTQLTSYSAQCDMSSQKINVTLYTAGQSEWKLTNKLYSRHTLGTMTDFNIIILKSLKLLINQQAQNIYVLQN